MNEKCKKCGNVSEGDTYTFHHGLKTAENVQKAGVTGKHRIITTKYSNISSASYYLCDDCVSRKVKRNLLIGLIGGIVFALLTLFFWRTKPDISFLPGLVMSCLMAVILCGFPIISLVLFAFGLLSLRKKITGEDLAIEIGRDEFKMSDAFWNSAEYKNLTND